jgi:hypothetical protein
MKQKEMNGLEMAQQTGADRENETGRKKHHLGELCQCQDPRLTEGKNQDRQGRTQRKCSDLGAENCKHTAKWE